VENNLYEIFKTLMCVGDIKLSDKEYSLSGLHLMVIKLVCKNKIQFYYLYRKNTIKHSVSLSTLEKLINAGVDLDELTEVITIQASMLHFLLQKKVSPYTIERYGVNCMDITYEEISNIIKEYAKLHTLSSYSGQIRFERLLAKGIDNNKPPWKDIKEMYLLIKKGHGQTHSTRYYLLIKALEFASEGENTNVQTIEEVLTLTMNETSYRVKGGVYYKVNQLFKDLKVSEKEKENISLLLTKL